MHKLVELEDKLCKQLEEYSEKELNPTSLEVIDKLAHALKNLNKITDRYNEKSGNSYGMYETRRMPAVNVYERGIRREPMGGYSRTGYSRHGDVVMELTDLMNEVSDERVRMELQKCIQNVQMM